MLNTQKFCKKKLICTYMTNAQTIPVWVNIFPDGEKISQHMLNGRLSKTQREAAWIIWHGDWSWGRHEKKWTPPKRSWRIVTAMPMLPIAHWRWDFGVKRKLQSILNCITQTLREYLLRYIDDTHVMYHPKCQWEPNLGVKKLKWMT